MEGFLDGRVGAKMGSQAWASCEALAKSVATGPHEFA